MRDTVLQLDPFYRLVLAYAKADDRPRYALLFALDSRFAEVIRSTKEILIGQMRLTWWRDILTKPPTERPAGEPLIAEINRLEQSGESLTPVSALLDGWEAMLDDFPWDDRQFQNYAEARGRGFFGLGLGDQNLLTGPPADYGQAWALWDFARHCSDANMRQSAFDRCTEIASRLPRPDFDRSGRPLSILCNLMIRDVSKGKLTADLYNPAIAGRIIWHGMTGR